LVGCALLERAGGRCAEQAWRPRAGFLAGWDGLPKMEKLLQRSCWMSGQ